jgi:hypothetical protein
MQKQELTWTSQGMSVSKPTALTQAKQDQLRSNGQAGKHGHVHGDETETANSDEYRHDVHVRKSVEYLVHFRHQFDRLLAVGRYFVGGTTLWVPAKS